MWAGELVVTWQCCRDITAQEAEVQYYVCREQAKCQLTFFIPNLTILGACFNLQERRGREWKWCIHRYTSTIYTACSCRTNLIVPLIGSSFLQLCLFRTNCKSILSLNFLFFMSPLLLTALIAFLIFATCAPGSLSRARLSRAAAHAQYVVVVTAVSLN